MNLLERQLEWIVLLAQTPKQRNKSKSLKLFENTAKQLAKYLSTTNNGASEETKIGLEVWKFSKMISDTWLITIWESTIILATEDI